MASFFRIPIHSDRVVFAIDYSRSMTEALVLESRELDRVREDHSLPQTRLGYAQAELIRAVQLLPDGALFNVVVYSDGVARFSSGMERSTENSRRRAVSWVKLQETGELTNIYEALRTAFLDHLAPGGQRRFGELPDTIVFLTDGHATRGRLLQRESLVSLVDLWNRAADVVVHCVGLGEDHDKDLLSALASRTHGFYVDRADLSAARFERRPRVAPAEVDVLGEGPLAALFAKLGSTDWRERQRAARDIAASGSVAAALPRLAEALRAEKDAGARTAIVEAMLEAGGAAAAHFAGVLPEATDDTAEEVCDALATLGAAAAPALDALVQVLESDREFGPAAAARALGAIGPAARAGVPALERVAGEGDFSLRLEAELALRAIRGE